MDTFIKSGYQFKILDRHFERVNSVDQEYLRGNHLPNEIYRKYLPSTKHPTLNALLINIEIFYLSTKIYERILKEDHSSPN